MTNLMISMLFLAIFNSDASALKINQDDPYYRIVKTTSQIVGVRNANEEESLHSSIENSSLISVTQNQIKPPDGTPQSLPTVWQPTFFPWLLPTDNWGPISQNQNLNPLSIIDTFLKIWEIVQENKPVLSVNLKSATALPVGSQNDWTKLSGWYPDRIITYRVYSENFYGTKVIDFTGDLRVTFGGRLKGKGLYIASARFVPVQTIVLWGFGLNVTAEVPAVVNRGTEESPIGEIQMDINFQMEGAFATEAKSKSYIMRADGYIANSKQTKVYFQPERALTLK